MTNRGGKVEEVTDLFSWAPKSLWMLSAAMISKDACSLEGKLTNLDSVLKSRDITLPTKVCIVKVMVFPVVMHECESWTKMKAQLRRTDGAGEDLRLPWTARSSNQSILKGISLE